MTSADVFARLAALHSTDRNWLLENLPPDTRVRLVTALRSGADEPGLSAAVTPHADARFAVSTAEATAVANVLQVEPAWLTAAVLRIGPWPWSSAALKSLPFEHRPPLAVDGSVPVKPALQAALLAALARRLPPCEATEVPSRRAPRFDDLVQQVSSRRSTSVPPT